MQNLSLPKLYAILDASLLAKRRIELSTAAEQMRDAGVTLLQYRDKLATAQEILTNAALIQEIFAGTNATLILNDYPKIAAAVQWSGVHLGQGDLAPELARAALGPEAVIGLSTHNGTQVLEGDAAMERAGGSGYLAIGPVFATGSKENPDPVVGLEGVRRARPLTQLPLVAIGGITQENAASVIEAGADAVAVISALLPESGDIRGACEQFLAALK